MRQRSPSRASAAALAVGLLVAACTGGSDPPPGAEPRPEPRGVLRLAYPREPLSLNPLEATTPAERDVLRAVLPSLHLVTPQMAFQPSLLAEEPRVEVDGERMEVHFRLRDDARWSDRRPVTVRDVDFTWRAMSEAAPEVADGFERVVEVRQGSPTQGTLVLEPPTESWRELFSAGRFVLPARGRPEAAADWNEGPPVSGGPFSIGEGVPGRSLMLERNPAFFGPSPLLEGIELLFVPDPTTALQLLEAGEVDAVAPTLGAAWQSRLDAAPGVEVASAQGPSFVHLVMNAESLGPAQRRDLAGAIDRGRFAEVVLRDDAEPSDGVLAPGQPGAESPWSTYQGGSRPSVRKRLRLAYEATELLSLTARYVRAQLDLADVDVELVGVDPEVFHGSWLPRGRFDLALWEVRTGPTPSLARWFGSEGGENRSGLEDRRLDDLLEQAERGGPGGAVALVGAQERLAELAPVLPLFRPAATMGWRAGIAGIAPNASADGPLWNAWNWSLGEAATAAA